jgi:VWFA-related protein
MLRSAFVTFLLVFVLAAPLSFGQGAQSISEDEIRWGSRPYFPEPANAIHVKSNFVQVPVVVRDSNGKAVGGLKKSDFALSDNGRQVTISSFNVENVPGALIPAPVVSLPQNVNIEVRSVAPPPPPTPRYIALFFDNVSMRMFEVVAARRAAEDFVQKSLKPGDKIGIFTTSTYVSLDFTDNVPKLMETLGKLLSQRKKIGGMGNPCPAMNPYHAYEIVQTYNVHSDAMDLALHMPGCGDAHDIIAAAHNIVGQAEQFAQATLGIITDVIHYLGRMPSRRMIVNSKKE